MKVIRNWQDLEAYGINCLTGEACAYGYRLLCDMTEDGRKLFESVFGLQLTVKNTYPDGWNDNNARSIMLPAIMLQPLAVFALFTVDNCTQVYTDYDGAVYGVEATDEQTRVDMFLRFHQGALCEECQRYGKGGGINLTYRNPGHARNQHAMSGRTV